MGRLLKRLEEEAPSKGTGKGSKSPRYRIHLSDRSGPYGQPKGRGQSRSPRNGGRSSGGSRQRQLPQHQQRQQQEPALWMAARTGDTEKCQQLLAVRAEVDVRSKRWTPLMGAAELGHAGVVSLLLENKANVNAANKKGRSALSFAASPSDDGATRRESQILVMDLTTNKSASCSSLLIVLTAILMISYAIIPVIALSSHNVARNYVSVGKS